MSSRGSAFGWTFPKSPNSRPNAAVRVASEVSGARPVAAVVPVPAKRIAVPARTTPAPARATRASAQATPASARVTQGSKSTTGEPALRATKAAPVPGGAKVPRGATVPRGAKAAPASRTTTGAQIPAAAEAAPLPNSPKAVPKVSAVAHRPADQRPATLRLTAIPTGSRIVIPTGIAAEADVGADAAPVELTVTKPASLAPAEAPAAESMSTSLTRGIIDTDSEGISLFGTMSAAIEPTAKNPVSFLRRPLTVLLAAVAATLLIIAGALAFVASVNPFDVATSAGAPAGDSGPVEQRQAVPAPVPETATPSAAPSQPGVPPIAAEPILGPGSGRGPLLPSVPAPLQTRFVMSGPQANAAVPDSMVPASGLVTPGGSTNVQPTPPSTTPSPSASPSVNPTPTVPEPSTPPQTEPSPLPSPVDQPPVDPSPTPVDPQLPTPSPIDPAATIPLAAALLTQ